MSFSLSSIKRGHSLPPRVLIYAPHGIGKTTWAAGAPDPIFLPTEDGLGILDTPTFPLISSYDDMEAAIGTLLNEDHSFKTAVVDSADHLEPLIWAKACQINKWSSIEEPGYGKGYLAADELWRNLLDGLDALRDDRGMGIIITAHAKIKPFNGPENEPYDRYQIKLHDRASGLVQERMDAVFFANKKVSTVQTDTGFKRKVTRGISDGSRFIYTEERPSAVAKNRYKMPPSIPMPEEGGWDMFGQYVPFYASLYNPEAAALPAADPDDRDDAAPSPTTSDSK